MADEASRQRWRDNKRRSRAGQARPASPDFCPQGHPYDEANTYADSSGRRRCRICNCLRVTERTNRPGVESYGALLRYPRWAKLLYEEDPAGRLRRRKCVADVVVVAGQLTRVGNERIAAEEQAQVLDRLLSKHGSGLGEFDATECWRCGSLYVPDWRDATHGWIPVVEGHEWDGDPLCSRSCADAARKAWIKRLAHEEKMTRSLEWLGEAGGTT